MATINSQNTSHRVRRDMSGKVADYLGITFVFIDGEPTIRVAMVAEDGRNWQVRLDVAETANLFAGCDQVRTLKPANAA